MIYYNQYNNITTFFLAPLRSISPLSTLSMSRCHFIREPFAKLLAGAHRLQQVSLVARTTAEDDILHCLRLFQGIHELSSGHSLVVVPKKEKTILGKGTGSDFRGELGRTRNGGGWAVDGRWWRAVLGQCGGWAVEKAVFHISPTPFSSEPQSSSANLTTNSG